uniref:HTH La-type RNA-binding domain-containing protein n=1 Tax=Poecilia mexicana TaxID=48701 RepID=A0A3B3Y6Y8_9TELE
MGPFPTCLEYYFSSHNLERDFFLRRKMDAQGFLPISLIASFHRVQALTTDVSLIMEVMRHRSNTRYFRNRFNTWILSDLKPPRLSPRSSLFPQMKRYLKNKTDTLQIIKEALHTYKAHLNTFLELFIKNRPQN